MKKVLFVFISMVSLTNYAETPTSPDPESGKIVYLNGKYEGKYNSEGKRSGFGIAKVTESSYYEGNWENDLRQGNGFCAYPNGDKYTGGWDC
jgi:hypothetical protein